MKKIILTIFIVLSFSVFLLSETAAEKIGDYEFEKGKSNLYVNNRNAEKCIALTFDDGPHPKYTPQILDILDKYNAKATFFVIGKNAIAYPEIVKEEFKRGHQIGNHTFSHPDLKKISVSELIDEVNRTSDIIAEITGEKPVLFRPPGGYVNNLIVKEITTGGNMTVLWSWRQDTKDWSCPGIECVVSTVLDNLRDGDIVLFHDYNVENSPTPAALEEILAELSQKGYKFVTVSELMSM